MYILYIYRYWVRFLPKGKKLQFVVTERSYLSLKLYTVSARYQQFLIPLVQVQEMAIDSLSVQTRALHNS